MEQVVCSAHERVSGEGTRARLLAVVAGVQILLDQVAGLSERRQRRVAVVAVLGCRLQLSLNGSETLASRLACAQTLRRRWFNNSRLKCGRQAMV